MLAVPYVLGNAAGPVLAAWIWEYAGYDLVLTLSIVLICCGLVSLMAARSARPA